MTESEKLVLDRIQAGIPFTEKPFDAIGDDIGIAGSDVIRILKDCTLVRNISAIFNAEALGYRTTLAAFHADETAIERAAQFVSSSPCVSHNYLRDDPHYNLWFTLAVPAPYDPAIITARMAAACGIHDYLVLNSVSRMKIGVRVPFTDTHTEGHQPAFVSQRMLSDDEKKTVCILQENLPLEETPFDILAQKYHTDPAALLSSAQKLIDDGIIRRYAAILRHRESGFTANAMTAWKNPGSAISFFQNETAISHLYFRTAAHGTWDYPLFAMIHAKSDGDLVQIIKQLSSDSGVDDYKVLRSIKEFKKERVRYFDPAVGRWLADLEGSDD